MKFKEIGGGSAAAMELIFPADSPPFHVVAATKISGISDRQLNSCSRERTEAARGICDSEIFYGLDAYPGGECLDSQSHREIHLRAFRHRASKLDVVPPRKAVARRSTRHDHQSPLTIPIQTAMRIAPVFERNPKPSQCAEIVTANRRRSSNPTRSTHFSVSAFHRHQYGFISLSLYLPARKPPRRSRN
ncbi:hypothetical protein ACS0TY_008960 [Phlomoides rotata]